MKLLNICIPTYNRHKDLVELWETFLSKVILNYNEDVNIYIYDNSDDDIAKLNEAFFSKKVIYKKNKINIGFSQNVLRCVTTYDSEFVWCLSDNDFVRYKAFPQIINSLRDDKFDFLQLRYTYQDLTNETKECAIPEIITLKDYLRAKGSMPFTFLSCAIIKNNIINSSIFKEELGNNSFIQIPLFIEKIGIDAKMKLLYSPVIDYNFEYNGRFNIKDLYDSKNQIVNYLNDLYELDLVRVDVEKSVAWYILLHSVNLLKISDYTATRKFVTSKMLTKFSLPVLIFIGTSILPCFLKKNITAFLITRRILKSSIKEWWRKFRLVKNKMVCKKV